MIRASIDIGSNTVRALVALQENGATKRVGVLRRITRLSGQFNGSLSDTSVARTLEAVKECVQFARTHGAVEIRAACTGVVRRAANGSRFLDLLAREAGCRARLLTGDEEAALSALGTKRHLGDRCGEFLLVDVGGFSTEFVRVGSDDPRCASYDIGVVGLTESALRHDPPTSSEMGAVRDRVAVTIAGYFNGSLPPTLVGIAERRPRSPPWISPSTVSTRRGSTAMSSAAKPSMICSAASSR
ncbi:MAG: hypothetical protein M5R36_22845 [Deltaproteobacteria bacterium]|nr:hypothetical protein [Deltaproteobacteria bacterium]